MSETDFRSRVDDALERLFTKARETDEFEYVCALLRVRGLQSAGWDPLLETQQMVVDLLGLLQGPIRGDAKLRLGLLLYCHLTEVDAIYEVIDNMLRACEGKRFHIAPFSELYRAGGKSKGLLSKRIPPSAKTVVAHVREHAIDAGHSDLADILREMFDEEIRNAFFHSDYIIYGNEFRTREGRFARGNFVNSSLPVDEVVDIINKAFAFYQGFMSKRVDHIAGYKEPKKLYGRFGPNDELVPLELITEEGRGVCGFRSLPEEPQPPSKSEEEGTAV